MDDLISRQDAISIAKEIIGVHASYKAWAILEMLESLPSAEPTVSKMEQVGDCISRKAAIDAAKRTDYRGLSVEDVTKVTDAVIEEIKRLPSAERRGKWLDGCQYGMSATYWYRYCSECGYIREDDDIDKDSNYYPSGRTIRRIKNDSKRSNGMLYKCSLDYFG